VTPCASIMKGIVNYRWKKGFSPTHLHFYWVSRKDDLRTFPWLLLVLPELKAAQLRHNRFYDSSDPAKKQQLGTHLAALETELTEMSALAKSTEPSTPPRLAPLPDGWVEHTAGDGQRYYHNQATNATSWERPGGSPAAGGGARAAAAAKRAEVNELRAALREAASSTRDLTITLFITGCKPAEVEPQANPAPGSFAETVTSLQSATDPETGKPLVRIIAGRPNWAGEFTALKEEHRREEVGVVFCGAPAIAKALTTACAEHSDAVEGTIFRLHKENF